MTTIVSSINKGALNVRGNIHSSGNVTSLNNVNCVNLSLNAAQTPATINYVVSNAVGTPAWTVFFEYVMTIVYAGANTVYSVLSNQMVVGDGSTLTYTITHPPQVFSENYVSGVVNIMDVQSSGTYFYATIATYSTYSSQITTNYTFMNSNLSGSWARTQNTSITGKLAVNGDSNISGTSTSQFAVIRGQKSAPGIVNFRYSLTTTGTGTANGQSILWEILLYTVYGVTGTQTTVADYTVGNVYTLSWTYDTGITSDIFQSVIINRLTGTTTKYFTQIFSSSSNSVLSVSDTCPDNNGSNVWTQTVFDNNIYYPSILCNDVFSQGAGTFSGSLSAGNLNGYIEGLNTGDVTITSVPANGSAMGLTLNGQQLALTPATSQFPGIVTPSAQTFNGLKTFTNGLNSGSTITTPALTASQGITTGSLIVNSGGNVAINSRASFMPGNMLLSTSTSTGAITIGGGIGCANIYTNNTNVSTNVNIGNSAIYNFSATYTSTGGGTVLPLTLRYEIIVTTSAGLFSTITPYYTYISGSVIAVSWMYGANITSTNFTSAVINRITNQPSSTSFNFIQALSTTTFTQNSFNDTLPTNNGTTAWTESQALGLNTNINNGNIVCDILGTGNMNCTNLINTATINATGASRLNGIILATVGGTQSTLNYYEEFTSTLTFNNSANSISYSVNIVIIRCGRSITLSQSGSNGTKTLPAASTLVSTTSLPSRFISSVSHYAGIPIISANVNSVGLILCDTAGKITIYSGSLSTLSGAAGWYSSCMAYII